MLPGPSVRLTQGAAGVAWVGLAPVPGPRPPCPLSLHAGSARRTPSVSPRDRTSYRVRTLHPRDPSPPPPPRRRLRLPYPTQRPAFITGALKADGSRVSGAWASRHGRRPRSSSAIPSMVAMEPPATAEMPLVGHEGPDVPPLGRVSVKPTRHDVGERRRLDARGVSRLVLGHERYRIPVSRLCICLLV